MAVTLTAAELATAIRVGDTPEEAAQVDRLLATATALVLRHAPDAPGEIHTEAAVRVAGHLFDMPQAARGAGYADVLRNSGALALMLPWRRHRAGVVDRDTGGDTTTETTTGGVALPGGGVALPGVVVGQPVIVSVGSTPAPVVLPGFGRYLVRNRGPAVVNVAVAVQTPGDGVRLAKGDATTVQVDVDAGTRLWLWTGGGVATAAVVAVT